MLNFHGGILLKGGRSRNCGDPFNKKDFNNALISLGNLGDGSASVVVVLRVQGQIPIHDMPGTALVTHEVPASS